MNAIVLYDIVESPTHPDLAAASRRLGCERLAFTSQRKAIAMLKRRPPDLIVADFFYGYGNNYAGANVSNLDVLLRSVQRFAPAARTLVLADRGELPHTGKLAKLFALQAVIPLPASVEDVEAPLLKAVQAISDGGR
jgi:hypothetical protein